MSVLEKDFDREQKEYYVLSSRWAELPTSCLLDEAAVVKELDMHICTVEDARGVGLSVGEDEGVGSPFDFDIVGRSTSTVGNDDLGGGGEGLAGPISGFAGWFTVDFKSRTDDLGKDVAPQISNPAYLSTGPEMGYTHWGQVSGGIVCVSHSCHRIALTYLISTSTLSSPVIFLLSSKSSIYHRPYPS